ncbi:SCO2400 family protein [Streptomyces litmocidini]|uniref:SCO2400 family protein n=1 Tax=Streptomyces litmocidini TaxID=67318 RepID=UPI0036FB1317
MDYCSSCRRHLNGALVCPGCGAYAPDIAPTTTAGGHIVPAPVATATAGEGAAQGTLSPGTWHDGRLLDEMPVGAVLRGTSGSDAPAEPVDASTSPEGRAARRRQRARWRKNQRRAVVATAVALVGGGLAMGAMDRQSGDRAQAATAPQDPGTDAVEERGEQETPPPSVRPDAQRASVAPSTPPVESSVPHQQRRQYAAASLRTTPPASQAHAVAPLPRTEPPTPKPQNTSPASPAPTPPPARTGTTGTADTSAQPPATTDATGSPNQEPATQPNTTPTSTSPSEICVLVLCLPVSAS